MSNFLVVAARDWFSARHTPPHSQLHSPTCPEFSWRGSAIPSRLSLKFTSRSCVISFANALQQAPLKDRSARLSNSQLSCSLVITPLELCLLGCFGPHTSLLLLLPVTCLAHLPPSSFALHLTPTSHCASLTCPSKFSPWAAATISYHRLCLLLALLFCLQLALLFLHGFLGSDPGCFSLSFTSV